MKIQKPVKVLIKDYKTLLYFSSYLNILSRDLVVTLFLRHIVQMEQNRNLKFLFIKIAFFIVSQFMKVNDKHLFVCRRIS